MSNSSLPTQLDVNASFPAKVARFFRWIGYGLKTLGAIVIGLFVALGALGLLAGKKIRQLFTSTPNDDGPRPYR